MRVELADGVAWVGHVDWGVRDFHGYRTERGSSYNAYLIEDEQPALIDTVKAPYAEALLEHVAQRVDPASIAFVVCNHAEPDHAGALPRVMQACRRAELVCDDKCRRALQRHYDTRQWRFRVVADGDRLSLGRRTLSFIETPMVHWPESMFTYLEDEGLLFSMDAFGQHYASALRFDDECDMAVVMDEAKTYFANIVMLYSRPIEKVLERAGGLRLRMIAPSHGVIWRRHIDRIVGAYRDWVAFKPARKALVVYDTMWKSTERMAEAIAEGASASDIDVRVINVRASNLTVLAAEMLDAAAAAFGSPTLNKTLMPGMAAALTYLKGLGPRDKAGFAFGSYGWARGGATEVDAYLQAMKFVILREPLQVQFVPNAADLDGCRDAGRLLASAADSASAQPEN
jgi:flavorubredoxin